MTKYNFQVCVAGKVEKVDTPHTSEISCIAISDLFIATADASGMLVLYDKTNFQVLSNHWSYHKGRITGLEFWNDRNVLVSVALDRQICLWNLSSNPGLLGRLKDAHKEGLIAMAVDPTNDSVWTASSDRTIKAWSWKDLHELGTVA
jgi:WD40 repeat protein